MDECRKKDKEEYDAKIEKLNSVKPLYEVKADIIRAMDQSELDKKKESLRRMRSLSKKSGDTGKEDLENHRLKYFELKAQKDRALTDVREKHLFEIDEQNKVDLVKREH